MAIKNIGESLTSSQSVKELIREVQIASSSADFSQRITMDRIFKEIDWDYALTLANIFSFSENLDCKEYSLRIAHYCLSTPNTTSGQREFATIILRTLSNSISIQLAKTRGAIESELPSLPLPMLIDRVKNQLQTTIVLSNGETLDGNNFQVGLWKAIDENKLVTVSAPTSVGKSYIVEKWVEDYLRKATGKKVIYIVPTRALVQQVEKDFRILMERINIDNVEITSIPIDINFEAERNYVFVFTQERLQILLASISPRPVFDLLIVDEAHKIADSNRGVLLHHMLEEVLDGACNTKTIFLSPLISDPRVVVPHSILSNDNIKVVINECPMVNQNLFWAKQTPVASTKWELLLCIKSELAKVGTFTLPATPSSPLKRLPLVAYAIAHEEQGNIIYVNGAADAEKTALILADLLPQATSKGLCELIDIVKKTIHRDYILAETLASGVAFHYGNMPLLIRTEIERLFSEGVIKYLICTSTLIEGVNMACRNIFMRGPQRGRNKLMKEEDFWNLAGRAGRWGKEFAGHIFCVDSDMPELWPGGEPPRVRRSYLIEKPIDSVFANPEDLLNFIQSRSDKAIVRKNRGLESVLSYLIDRHLRNGGIENILWLKRYPSHVVLRVSKAVEQLIENFSLPLGIVENNPGIDPLAMQDLYNYFKTRGKNPEEYLPVDPSSNNAVDRFTSIFGCTYNHLGSALGSGARTFYLSLLVVNWMRGHSLPRLISERFKREKKANEKVKIATVIRNVMQEVETIARFEAPKYIRCYTDVLKYYLRTNGMSELGENIPNYNLYLEFGVSIPTQISLIKSGLSRTTAILLSATISRDNLSEREVVEWLTSDQKWRNYDLPELVIREIDEMLKSTKALRILSL